MHAQPSDAHGRPGSSGLHRGPGGGARPRRFAGLGPRCSLGGRARARGSKVGLDERHALLLLLGRTRGQAFGPSRLQVGRITAAADRARRIVNDVLKSIYFQKHI